MATTSSEADTRPLREAFQKSRWTLMGLGVLLIVLGGLAVAWPTVSTIAFDLYVGWLFLFSGVVSLIALFSTRSIGAFLWTLLSAFVSLAAGAYLIRQPAAGAVSLTIVLAVLFIIEGVLQIIASIGFRNAFPQSWGWMLVSGLVDLALAALIISGWPASAAWTLGLLVGVNLISTGVAILMPAAASGNLVAAVDRATAGR